MVRRLLFAALLGLSIWTVGARAQACLQQDQARPVTPAATACAVISSDSTNATEDRWNAVPHGASLGWSVWRAQPHDAAVATFASAVRQFATTLFATARPRSPSVPPHLQDIPLLI